MLSESVSDGAAYGYLRGATMRPFRFVKPLLCRDNLAELANELGLFGVAVEVGVYDGSLSAKFLSVWKGRHYFMIDARPRLALDPSTLGACLHLAG